MPVEGKDRYNFNRSGEVGRGEKLCVVWPDMHKDLLMGERSCKSLKSNFFSPPVPNSVHPCESVPAWKAFSEAAVNLFAFFSLEKKSWRPPTRWTEKHSLLHPWTGKSGAFLCWTQRLSRANYLQWQIVLQRVFGQNKRKILQVSYDIFQAYLVIDAEYPQLC